MAVTLNVGDYKRREFYMVDPFEVIVREELRGRSRPPTEEQLIEMAESFLEYGQRQPVEARKIEDNKILLVMGFTRTAAARLVRSGFTGSDGTHKQNPEFQLKVTLTDANETTAFISNVVENAHRNQTSPVDDAFNQHKLRDQCGMSDTEIMRLFRYKDPNKVGRLRKLLSCTRDIQDMVHEGFMSVQGAIDLLDAPTLVQQEAIKQARSDNGVVDGAKVREVIREHNLASAESPVKGTEAPTTNGEATETKKPKHVPRSMRELKRWLEKDRDDEAQARFCTVLLEWIAGKRTDKALDNALASLAWKAPQD